MQVRMHITDAGLAEAIKAYVERRLRFGLARFGRRVGQITVRIVADGQKDTRCRISVEILPFGHVAVEESDIDLLTAIDRATGRIGRQFGRERMRELRVGRQSVRLVA